MAKAEGTHVTVSESKKSVVNKKTGIVVGLLVLILVFAGGVLVGRQMGREQLESEFKNTVGSSQTTVESYNLTVLGQTLEFTEDQSTNESIERDFLFSLKEDELQKGSVEDLIIVYNMAEKRGATSASDKVAKVLKARSSELSQEQKDQLNNNGLDL